MPSGRRDKFEIFEEILKLTRDRIGKTAIIYGANLNHSRANEYLGILKSKGFIEVGEEKPKKYEITEKGENFLEHFVSLKKEFDE